MDQDLYKVRVLREIDDFSSWVEKGDIEKNAEEVNEMSTLPIYVINMQHDIEKREHMETICRKFQLNCQFIAAVDGKQLTEKEKKVVYDSQEAIDLTGQELLDGEIGCALSHKKIYQEIVDKKIPVALILEDDIVLNENFPTLLENIDKFPKNWELVLLGYHSCRSRSDLPVMNVFHRKKISDCCQLVRLSEVAHGTYGYLITLKGAAKMLNILQKITMPIDHFTGVDKYVQMYAVSPVVVDINEDLDRYSAIAEERDKTEISSHATPLKTFLKKTVFYEPLKIVKKILRKILLSVKPIRRYH